MIFIALFLYVGGSMLIYATSHNRTMKRTRELDNMLFPVPTWDECKQRNEYRGTND